MKNNNVSHCIRTTLFAQPIILKSWRFASAVEIEQGLKFNVSGFRLTGTVEVKCNETTDLFDLTLFTEDNEVRNTVVGVNLDKLVSTIDEQVEKVDDYVERVIREYGIQNNDKDN